MQLRPVQQIKDATKKETAKKGATRNNKQMKDATKKDATKKEAT